MQWYNCKCRLWNNTILDYLCVIVVCWNTVATGLLMRTKWWGSNEIVSIIQNVKFVVWYIYHLFYRSVHAVTLTWSTKQNVMMTLWYVLEILAQELVRKQDLFYVMNLYCNNAEKCGGYLLPNFQSFKLVNSDFSFTKYIR